MKEIFCSLYARVFCAIAAFALIVGAALRIALFSVFYEDFERRFSSLFQSLALGAINDLFSLVFMLLTASIFILPFSDRFYASRLGKTYLYCLQYIFVFFTSFVALLEFLFWDRYHTRFNFLIVDYISNGAGYAENVFNLRPLFFVVVAIIAIAFTLGAKAIFFRAPLLPLAGRTRLSFFWILAALAALVYYFHTPFALKSDRYFSSLALNGAYEYILACRGGEVDYNDLYAKTSKDQAFALTIGEIKDNDSVFLMNGAKDFRKIVSAKADEITPNVIVIVAKGLSANAIGEHTPQINSLIDESTYFSRMHSIGLNASRSIEAIVLSLPPIAGEASLRRFNNRSFVSTGNIFIDKGYSAQFIYGGYADYDELDVFFAANAYEVIDRNAFDAQNKTFSAHNALCDEDLFGEAISQADLLYSQGKKFHQILLTSSNSPPYKYPQGRIDDAFTKKGAERYFDYALDRFISAAKNRDWFNDTIFVIIGDNSNYENTQNGLSPNAYKIPAFIYAPKLIAPRKIDILSSQIDVAPTLFALFGWGYESRFFGRDIFSMQSGEGRAWIATNTLLGFTIASGDLAILRPSEKANFSKSVVRRAVATYQTAHELFNEAAIDKRREKR